MTVNLSTSEQLVYTTTRIECTLANGQITQGTGFFFNYLKDGNISFPAIVTNKHVVDGAVSGRFFIHTHDGQGNPKAGEYFGVHIETEFQNSWINHPDSDVDLCVLPTGKLFHEAKSQGRTPFWIGLDDSLVATQDKLGTLTSIEDIVMIGYPSGIWDSKNNMPIVRRGITATHPAYDYEGRKEFMIDAACFPGSSGSPVFLYNAGSYPTKSGDIAIGTRVLLLGILYAGPQYTASGDIEIINVPIQQRAIALSRIPNNLGNVIKAEKLLDFNEILKQRSTAK